MHRVGTIDGTNKRDGEGASYKQRYAVELIILKHVGCLCVRLEMTALHLYGALSTFVHGRVEPLTS